MTPESIIDYLGEAVRQRAPKRLLLINPGDALSERADAEMPVQGRIKRCTPDDIPDLLALAQPRYDLAIVADTLERLEPSVTRPIIGRLRDRLAQGVLVVIDQSDEQAVSWSIADFIALGFRRAPQSRALAPGWHVYRYDIHDYKTTPDWLNARYWANPERWDEQRW